MGSGDIDYLLELLAPLGRIRARRMFGGWGLYCNERFFALVAEDQLYVKVDAISEPDFRAAGCQPFVYTGQARPITMSYWSLPDEAYDSAEAMLPWARRAFEAAGRAAAGKVKPDRNVAMRKPGTKKGVAKTPAAKKARRVGR